MSKAAGKTMALFILLTLSLAGYPALQAQEYPTKPVTLVNPMGAGGSHDLTMRAVVSVAPDYLGQPIVFLFRSGQSSPLPTPPPNVAAHHKDHHQAVQRDHQGRGHLYHPLHLVRANQQCAEQN